jgi:hypothetical protein
MPKQKGNALLALQNVSPHPHHLSFNLSKAISDQPNQLKQFIILLHASHQRFTPARDWYLALPGNKLAGAR